jgi:hypothetical protein
MLTLTAPGDKAHRLPGGDLCRCTPEGGVDLARWNGQAVPRWNRLHQDLERAYGCELIYLKATEVQGRGALHFHVLIRLPIGVELKRSHVRRLAIDHGFGHELDIAPVTSMAAAGYCAKYVSKAAAERPDVPYVHPSTGEIGPGNWRTWSSSRAWGVTMGQVLADQARWARERVDQGDELVAPEAPLDTKGIRYTDPPSTGIEKREKSSWLSKTNGNGAL